MTGSGGYPMSLMTNVERVVPSEILARYSEDGAYLIYFIGPPALIVAFFIVGFAVLVVKKQREWRQLEPYMRVNNEFEGEPPLTQPPTFRS